MHVALDPIADLPATALSRWRDLAARAAAPNPFAEPALTVAAANELPGGRDATLLSVSWNDQMVLAAPVVRVGRYRRFPLGALVTWRHAHCCSGEPLVDADATADVTAEAWSAVIDHVVAEKVPWLVLELVHEGGAATRGLRDALAARQREARAFDAHQRAVVHKRAEPTYVDEQLSARHRSDQRRKLRGLATALDAEVTASDLLSSTTDASAAVHAFIELEASGWKGRNGTALANHANEVAFFERTCAELHAQRRLQMWRIGSPDRTVALACNVIGGDTVFRFKLAYDEELRRFSPGVQLELAMLDAFHADPALEWIDSCAGAGDTVYRQLYPDRRPTATLLIAPRSRRGRVVAAAAPRAASAFRRARRALYRLLRREPPPDYGLLG